MSGGVTTRPYVVAHVAVSLDGAANGFQPDVARFYELAATWEEDVTRTGANTILAQESALAGADRPGPNTAGPLLAVTDSRGRVRSWEALREVGHWSGVLALRSETSPRAGQGDPVTELVVGSDRVDLAAAVRLLGERPGVEVIRVDSGGSLIGALLHDGLIDEVSLLVHPHWTGQGDLRLWHGSAASAPAQLELIPAKCSTSSCGCATGSSGSSHLAAVLGQGNIDGRRWLLEGKERELAMLEAFETPTRRLRRRAVPERNDETSDAGPWPNRA
jgi:2,5-diamino-6-(ribosylamino)-4(3H)-pyrimidinone 5'-phosphate reductase